MRKTLVQKLNNLKKTQFSRPQLALFAIVFSLIGFLIYRSFAAAPLVASLESEQMSLPVGGSVLTDTAASAGKALYLPDNGTTTGSVSFPSTVSSLTLMAKGTQCNGAPVVSVSLDSSSLLSNTSVSATSWTAYSVTPANTINAGTHTLSISFANDYTKPKGNPHNQCSRALYLDVTNFYGPTPAPNPAPTVSLSATPTSVTAGSASTLTWNSTNATSCSASGAWSGTQATSGSTSTGALNQNSTYTLSCSGAGGTGSGTAVVSVGAAATPAVPTGLAATSGNGSVTLNWTANPTSDAVDRYQVYVNDNNNDLNVTGTSFTVSGLTNGTTYSFRISAHNSAGYGGWTDPVSSTPGGAAVSGGLNFGNGFLLFRYGDSWNLSPSTGYDRYGVVVVGYGDDLKVAALPTAKGLTYRMGGETDSCANASDCLDGVPLDQARANGWVLKNSSGGDVLYGGTDAAADIGDANYQKAWADNVIARLTLKGLDGVFEDNLICEPYFQSTPAKYPTRAAYETAYLSFLSYISGRLHASGKYLLGNTLCYGGGASNAAWWSQVAKYADGMLTETFETSNDHTTVINNGSGEWLSNLTVIDTAQNAGKDAYAVGFDTNFSGAIAMYSRASYLLKWNGKSGGWGLNLSGSDPWNSVVFADIGTPSGTMQQSGVGYWRQYTKGQAIVNPSPSSSVTINGHALQPLTSYIGP